jgi:stage II sporulation protein P
MLRIGQEIAQILNQSGIPALHDTTMHDASGYDAAYERTEVAISAYLEQYPSICMVIDVHRDAAQASDGSQISRTTILNGQEMAQLLLVMGTDTAELPHPNWEQNLSFALKLQAYIAQSAPDLMRPLMLRAARYNELLTPQSILLEVVTAGENAAMEYGIASAILYPLSAFLQNHSQVKSRAVETNIQCDFDGFEGDISYDLVLRIFVGSFIPILLRVLKSLWKESKANEGN